MARPMPSKSATCRHFWCRMLYKGMVALNPMQAFRAIDADRSGGISQREFTNGQIFGTSGLRAAIGNSSAKQIFTKFDADKNGSLNASELSQGLALVTPDTASLLLAAQEKQSDSSKFFSGQKVAAYSTLPSLNTSQSGSTAYDVLAAYFKI